MSWESKPAGATLDYNVDWSAWLDTDTIATSAWTATTGITKGTSTTTTTVATVWLSGGTAGAVYTVVNTITTAGGRTMTRTEPLEVIP